MAIGGGVTSAVLWYLYSTVRGQSEGTDKLTPVLLVLLPVGFVLLRRPIDWALRPIQVVRKHVPRLVIIGAGLAAPYGIAVWMYNNPIAERLFQVRMREYPYAARVLVVGTIVSYLILRTPRGGPGRRRIVPTTALMAVLPAMSFVAASTAGTALADHYLQDPWNLNDGLRTDGWAPVLAGTGATIVSVLINGNEVIRTLLNPKGDDGKTDGEPTRYQMLINTEEERMSLAADGNDRLWVYAQLACNKPAVPAQSLTRAISFTFSGRYGSWMSIKSTNFVNGYKAVSLAATPPTPESKVEEGATVTVNIHGATAEGEPIDVPLELSLDPELKLDVTVLA